MRRLFVACVVVVVACVVASLPSGASQTTVAGRWVIRDLGTAGGVASRAVDVNERGEVVGSLDTVRTRTDMPSHHAFLWSHGRMRDLGTLPLGGGGDIPNVSEATAINDHRQIVGTSYREQTGPIPHVFFWSASVMRTLGCGRVAPTGTDAAARRAELVSAAAHPAEAQRALDHLELPAPRCALEY
jgi:probable HAF family extracellular repeat protein